MKTTFSDLIILLAGGINQRRLYFDKHPKVRGAARDFVRKLDEVLVHTGQTGFFFGILDGKFIREGRFLVGPSIAGRCLVQFAERMMCGGFLVRRGVTEEEIQTFIRIGATLNDKVENLEAAKNMMRREGIINIDPSPHYREQGAADGPTRDDLSTFDPGLIRFDFDDGDGGPPVSMHEELQPLLPIFQAMYDTIADNNLHVSRDEDVDVDRTMGVGEELMNLADRQTMDVMNLMRYPDYDSYTIGHSVRLSTLALTVGRAMNWPLHLQTELASAAMLHDVGMARVPEEILYKPGELTDEERKVAESHAEIGARILMSRGDVSPSVIAGAWGHHIRHDGGGYPQAPEWVSRSPVASLLQVCDVFEALTAARPYKAPMPPRRAFEIILKDHTAFDPTCLRALIRAVGLFPPGSEILLNNGCRAFVAAHGPTWDNPVVRIISKPDGSRLEPDDQRTVHLADDPELAMDEFRVVELSGV
ncbi:hypothetical protein COW53_05465 [bacterium CG17_big_fil_post_rev_8_21_14_2_50_64_8]|nr:MAG: hypothetical protein COW53_05465 [bacterium CG17_big_fil_post_rev_8_21_14_2_50_64_8]PJA75822.1 MAG: hypothetical protein CO151_04660 [bacterium CG_4_9_14_3_um_filter_65_15]